MAAGPATLASTMLGEIFALFGAMPFGSGCVAIIRGGSALVVGSG